MAQRAQLRSHHGHIHCNLSQAEENEAPPEHNPLPANTPQINEWKTLAKPDQHRRENESDARKSDERYDKKEEDMSTSADGEDSQGETPKRKGIE